jgi:hypothetical protein
MVATSMNIGCVVMFYASSNLYDYVHGEIYRDATLAVLKKINFVEAGAVQVIGSMNDDFLLKNKNGTGKSQGLRMAGTVAKITIGG